MFGCKSRFLKDKLNRGLQVDWEHESVTAAATTLKVGYILVSSAHGRKAGGWFPS